MPRLFRRLFKTAKRHIKEGLRDQRNFQLYRVACRLLAEQDHEKISVAQISREAGISVGAFYQRFPNKDAFLHMVVAQRLRSTQERMERELASERWQRATTGAVTRAIVEEMMRGLHGPGAGVVRMALKRGHLERRDLRPLLDYRAALADRAVALLSHRSKGVRHSERVIRATVQMAQATALDVLLNDAGTLRPGSLRMADMLTAMMLSMLDPSAATKDANKGDETDEEAEEGKAEPMLKMPIEDVVAQPIAEPAFVLAIPTRRKTMQPPAAQPMQAQSLMPAAAKKSAPILPRKR